MARPKLTLYVDTVSPFTYQAYWLLRNDPAFSKCNITYIPVFLGGIMKACNNVTPISIRNKDKWVAEERLRWARLFHIPMVDATPAGFPPLTLSVMRALCVVYRDGRTEDLERCLDALFRAYWVDGRRTHEGDVLVDVLAAVLGEEDTQRIMERAGKEGKEVLGKNTDRALADGAFGLPWFVATNKNGEKQGYWGVDHLAQVTEFLGLERPSAGGWKSLL